jgi:hypothetical protein
LNVYSCEEVKQGRGVMPEKRIYGCENGAWSTYRAPCR